MTTSIRAVCTSPHGARTSVVIGPRTYRNASPQPVGHPVRTAIHLPSRATQSYENAPRRVGRLRATVSDRTNPFVTSSMDSTQRVHEPSFRPPLALTLIFQAFRSRSAGRPAAAEPAVPGRQFAGPEPELVVANHPPIGGSLMTVKIRIPGRFHVLVFCHESHASFRTIRMVS